MKSFWPTKKLGEICEEILSGDWGTEKEKTGSLLCKVIRGTDFVLVQNGKLSELPDRYIEIEKFEKIKLKPGDILIEISGGSKDQPTGRILFWDRNETLPIVFSNFVKKILLNTKIVEPKFFFRYWQLLYFKGITKNYEDRTTNIRNFKLKEFLENKEIPIPPLPIQQKIVKILDMIQEAVEIQEKIIEKTKELKKSLMAELFKYGAPSFRKGRKLKKTEIGEIPEDWEVVRLGEIAEVTSSKRIFQSEYVQRGIDFYRSKEIVELANNSFKSSEFFISEERYNEIKNKYGVPKKNDILITAIGTIGISWVVPDNRKFYFKDGNLLWIKNLKNLNPYYLKYFFDTFLNRIATLPTGAPYKALTIEQLNNFQIALPPLPEQQEIAEILQTIDQKIEIEKKKKELYEELFKTMLNKIMNQEIDVEKIEV